MSCVHASAGARSMHGQTPCAGTARVPCVTDPLSRSSVSWTDVAASVCIGTDASASAIRVRDGSSGSTVRFQPLRAAPVGDAWSAGVGAECRVARVAATGQHACTLRFNCFVVGRLPAPVVGTRVRGHVARWNDGDGGTHGRREKCGEQHDLTDTEKALHGRFLPWRWR